MSARLLTACLALAAAAGAVPATWWLVGDVSEPDGVDRMVRPPDVPLRVTVLLGVAGLVVVLAVASVLVDAVRDGRLPAAASRPVLYAVLTGAGAGWTGRVVTSAVIGANIGGGFLLLVGPWVLVGVAVAIAAELRSL